MNQLLEFRMADDNDIGLVWRIVNTSFEEYRNSEAPSSALMETEDHVRQTLNNGRERAVICYYGGKPAAAVRFYIEDGLYFRRLGVLPEYRRKGISKALISWLEEYALKKGESRIWCYTRSSVERNMSLYRSLGFELLDNVQVERNGKHVGIATFSKNLFKK